MANSDDKKVKDLLENLPTFKDDLNKDELYERISMHVSEKSVKKPKHFIPFLSVAAVLFLLLSIPFLTNNNYDEQMSMEMEDTVNDEEIFSTAIESSDSTSNEFEQEEAGEAADIEVLSGKSGVIHQIPPERELIHLTIHNKFGKYMIPVTIIVPSEEEADYNIEQINGILDSIDILQKGDFIEKVDLTEQKASFMLYQGKYYASLPQDTSKTIYEALRTLQKSELDTFLENTIDPSAKFIVSEVDNLLSIQFEEGTIEDEDITIQMVESILLTAKSYGFTEVLFKQMPVEEVGDYQFASSIPVPIAANPLKAVQ